MDTNKKSKSKVNNQSKGLSDQELVKKYDNGVKVDFKEVLKRVAKVTR